MNRVRQLWRLIRHDNETPAITRSREAEERSEVRQAATRKLLRERELPIEQAYFPERRRMR